VTDPQEAGAPFSLAARLYPASPNPFNPTTRIRYAMQRDGVAEIAVFNVAGARVRTLVKGLVLAGEHETAWDGLDDAGKRMASGVYLCLLRAGGAMESQRLVLIK
jgi:hypothetical protein